MRSVLVGVALAAAGLLVVPSVAAADAPSSALFVQSAQGGRFDDGRLKLRGVSPAVVWFTEEPARDSGTVSFATLRRGLFARGRPAPNAALAIEGGGLDGVVALELRDPRYNARRRTVSYRVRRLRDVGGRLDRFADELSRRRLPRRFGAASLFIDNSLGKTCYTTVVNATGKGS
jgi:hypothetical protein